MEERTVDIRNQGWQAYADPAGHPFCLCRHHTALT